MKSFYFTLSVMLFIFSCKQKDNFTPELNWVNYNLKATDTLNFKTAGTPQYIAITLDSISGPADTVSFLATCRNFSNLSFKNTPDSLIFKKNANTNFGITHTNNFVLLPGLDYCQLNVTQLFVKNPKVISKTIILNTQPTCAYNYKTFRTSSLTTNGSSLNKPVSCTYTGNASLKVELLLDTPIELDFDCPNNKIAILPITYNGANFSGTGIFNKDTISLTILNNGIAYATASIFK